MKPTFWDESLQLTKIKRTTQVAVNPPRSTSKGTTPLTGQSDCIRIFPQALPDIWLCHCPRQLTRPPCAQVARVMCPLLSGQPQSTAVPDTRAFVSVTARALGGSRLWGILTLVDGCWKALEENTTVRTVNDYTLLVRLIWNMRKHLSQ